jgi:quercetin dioxygenase-like cupin family protein
VTGDTGAIVSARDGHSVVDLDAIGDTPTSGIRSITLHADDAVKVIHFDFAPGEELSEHTSPRRATIQVLSGDFDLTVAGEAIDGGPGTLVCMAAGTPHGLRARRASRMLLTLVGITTPPSSM